MVMDQQKYSLAIKIDLIIKEELTGTALKPTILLSVKNASDLMNDKLTVLI